MKNKLLSIVALALVLFVAGCTKKEETQADTLDKILQRGKLVVGVKYDAKPFGYLNQKGVPVGFDVDLARYIAKTLLGDENKVEFKQVTPSSRILALTSGQVDMVIATMTITASRSQIVDFSVPYYVSGQAILVPRNSKIRSISDLNGKKAIVVFGSTAERNLRLMAPETEIIGFKTYPSAFMALKEGRADAMTSDDTILIGYAISDKSVKLLPKQYSKEPYAVALKKGNESSRLKSRVDAIVEDMERSGELNQLKHKWIEY